MSLRVRLAPVLIVLAGCDRGGGDGGVTTSSESDGDTTVVRATGVPDPSQILRLAPELSIGQIDGAAEYQFASVGELVPTADGGLYVWDGDPGTVRQYDSAGRFVRQVGRQGAGPGEYGQSNGMALLAGGRLVLWDASHGRMNVYDSAGTFSGSWRAFSPAIGPRGISVDSTGRLYLRGPIREPQLPDVSPDANGFLAVDAATGSPIRFFPAPTSPITSPRIAASRAGRVVVFRTVPFAPQSGSRWSPHGYYVSWRGDRYAVTLHRQGATLQIQRDVPSVPLDSDERANHEERAIAGMRRQEPGWRWSGPPIPDHKPFIVGLMLGRDGRIWVQRPLPGERIPLAELDTTTSGGLPPLRWRESTAYDIFEPDGRFVGVLSPPLGTMLQYSDGGRVWGVVRDSLDVPRIVRFRLEAGR